MHGTYRGIYVMVIILWAVGCGRHDKPAGEPYPPPPTSPVTIRVSLPPRQGMPTVARVVVKVSGPEIVGTLQWELAYNPQTNTASGTINVPNGIDRLFVVEALDAEGNVLYVGSTVADVEPPPTQNPPITLELWPPEDKFGWGLIQLDMSQAIPNAYLGIGRIRVCYGPFRDGQSPHTGIYPSEQQIQEDLSLVQPFVQAIRTYGTARILKEIPRIAKERGIACLAGAWISRNTADNQSEIQNLIAIAQAGQAQKIAVGNEVLLRGDLAKEELIALIQQVKQAVSVPVSTGEIYPTWLANPDLADACDYLLVHIHPYQEGIPVEESLERVESIYRQLRAAYPNKPIVIGEVGWPSDGQTEGQAVPNPVNQRRFVRQVVEWAKANGVEVYIFELFDEKWKIADEGPVGAHWGLFFSDRTMKPQIQKIWF